MVTMVTIKQEIHWFTGLWTVLGYYAVELSIS